MSTKIIVQAKDLTIGYHNKLIGQHLNFDLSATKVTCLLGPNGSGKSTLFKSLLGLIPSLDGQVQVLQRNITSYSKRDLAQLLAYVPQAVAGVFAFRVLDVVLMGRSAYIKIFSAPSRLDYEIAEQSLVQLGISHLAGRIYTELSGGEQQLVLIARALVQQPKMLVLDEPTASLDFGNQIRILDQIQALSAQGLAIFFCTHQPEQAYRVADEVLLFKQGEIVQTGPSKLVLTANALAELYDLPVVLVKEHLKNAIS